MFPTFQWKESRFSAKVFQCSNIGIHVFHMWNSIVVQATHAMDVPHGGEDAAVVAHTGSLREER
jgi:hypothetical protein